MAKQIDFQVKPEKEDEVTVEEIDKVREFVDTLNYLSEEGFIEIEQDEDGTPQFFPTESPVV